jgi:membrane-anchored protein YejM (alkaline phosphatase superfamily)
MVDNSNSYKDRVSRLISWGHWFMFANIMLAMLMAIRYIFAAEGQATFISVFYVISTWIGHFGLLGIIAYIVILFPLTFLVPYSKLLRGLGAALATIIIIALLIDGSVYQNYQLHFNLLVFDLEGFNLNNTIGWSSIALFMLALLIVELTIANLIWKRLHIIRRWDIGNRLTLSFAAMFVVSHLIHIWADAVIYRPVLAFDRMFPFSHQSTARGLIKKYGWIDDKHQSQIILNSSAKKVQYPLHPLQCRVSNNKNLLIVTIDTANSDLVTPHVMPNLYKLGQRGIFAKQHITSSLKAADAVFGLQTGIPAIYRPAFEKQKLTSPLIELTNTSKRKSFGIDTYKLNNVESSLADNKNVDALISWINANTNDQYYGDITLYASQQLSIGHQPLLDFDKKVAPSKSAPQRILAKQYINALHYTDKLLGKLISNIDLTKTTIVVTANRGADLSTIYQQEKSVYSYVNLHVPMIIAGPTIAALMVNKVTSHYDMLPTLLKTHFDCGNPASDFSVGYSLTSTQTSDMLYLGDAQYFSLYKNGNITEIDRQGQYRFFDKNYMRQTNGHLSFQSLIDLMANIQRFKPH